MNRDINNMKIYDASVKEKIECLIEYISSVGYKGAEEEIKVLNGYLRAGENLTTEDFEKFYGVSLDIIASYVYSRACEEYGISR